MIRRNILILVILLAVAAMCYVLTGGNKASVARRGGHGATSEVATQERDTVGDGDRRLILSFVKSKVKGARMDSISLDSTVRQIKQTFYIRQSLVSSATPVVDNGSFGGRRMSWMLSLRLSHPFGSKADERPRSMMLQISLTPQAQRQADRITRDVAALFGARPEQAVRYYGQSLMVWRDMGNVYISIAREADDLHAPKPQKPDADTFDFT